MDVRGLLFGVAALALCPLPALAQTSQPQEVVISGQADRMSDWHVAEGDHVIVYSDGDQRALARVTHNLERLHFLLSILLNRVGKPDDAAKLRITLVGDAVEFDEMNLRNIRSQQGPYARAFPVQRYYDPREDGAVMAVSRTDSSVEIERSARVDIATLGTLQMNPETGQLENSMFGSGPPTQSQAISTAGNIVPLPAEGRLYGAYAQHYLLTYLPAAYPRWYLDGMGELFSTMQIQADGSIDYGRMPEGYRRVMEEFPTVQVADILTGRYLTAPKTKWNPFHAWILTHYLFFNDTRRAQLSRYLASIGRGGSMEQASTAFGDLDKLQREVRAYDNTKLVFERMTYPAERAGEPAVTRLTQRQAAFLKGRIELGSRVEIPPAPPAGTAPETAAQMTAVRDKALAARDRWLVRLRGTAASNPASLEAQLLLAEAECRSNNSNGCLAAADAALRAQNEDSRALAWKGVALTQIAVSGPASERQARLREARAIIVRANRMDNEGSLPLLAYYRSFADAGEPATKAAAEGLLKSVQNVPAAPGPRVLLGEEFARTGHRDAAADAVMPVANGPYDSPERPRAEAVLKATK